MTAVSASLATLGVVSAYQTMSRRKQRRELNLAAARSLAMSEALRPSDMRGWEGSVGVGSERVLSSSSSAGAAGTGTGAGAGAYDEGLIREQLARNYAFFGEEAMSRVRGARVVVVGCGGVGSYAALMLARSGVSQLRLVDFDYVTLSSLNRHATAVLADVGTPKVGCVERTIRQIAKWVEVDARVEIWRRDAGGGRLLEGADWVVGEPSVCSGEKQV